MTDRELLELAAKAAGINLDLTLRPDGKPLGCSERGLAIDDVPGWWNPLTSDADALRLAVKLAIDFNVRNGATWWDRAESLGGVIHWHHEPHNDDPYAATRRAIVRAAAEIGRE